MKTIIAKKDFRLNGKYYYKDSEIKIKNYADLVKLNQNGFIIPLSSEDMKEIKEELKNKRSVTLKKKKEEEVNG